ncbi:MAG: UDP-N-acetylglucosamine--N-acetylmuramyl-(pentapeptide) pyrophosphoryl-undecaprenol N-acetylglucosamine transferase [Candidatus Sungbacteria bacterium]|nr:UDP-N-acetylglucosamine--N-acetylmuramyl-(pentapeptide) pyrophosphoryl-undecaprenol N-acetylglucosamine transferase [Candidatus Sungbacteria bacterium]
MRILFTGGGTGGHFFPLLAVIRELKQAAEEQQILDIELFYMGPKTPYETLLLDEGVGIFHVTSGKVRRYFSLLNIVDIFRLFLGTAKAFWKMFFLVPDVVFSKGGYAALPAVIAAIIFRIPLVIHESDAVPGMVTKFSARFADRIGIAFPSAYENLPKEKTALVGVPIRKRILGGIKENAKEELDIFSALPVIGIIGSSQGAQKINDAILGIVKELTAKYEVLHQTGENNLEDVAGEAKTILEAGLSEHYHPVAFLDERNLRNFYLTSDLIISRASSLIFEIAAWGKPSIVIPLRNAAQDHQTQNAYTFAGEGACVVIQEENLTPHLLMAEIDKLISDPERMKKMGEAAQRFARVDAAAVVAKEILKVGMH